MKETAKCCHWRRRRGRSSPYEGGRGIEQFGRDASEVNGSHFSVFDACLPPAPPFPSPMSISTQSPKENRQDGMHYGVQGLDTRDRVPKKMVVSLYYE